jgi:very-short-patch-repair endonuclease
VEGLVRSTSKDTVARAKALRRTMTRPEARLWQVLRTRPEGLKFRRQHPIGPYVIDFYCPAAKLIIEVDGVVHDMGNRPVRDEARDRWLEERGFRICRIPARHLYGDIEPAMQLILLHTGP